MFKYKSGTLNSANETLKLAFLFYSSVEPDLHNEYTAFILGGTQKIPKCRGSMIYITKALDTFVFSIHILNQSKIV